uniref:Uncharacterized protein LOC111104931 n=1 Tax=Crassostrea virginica TaxID=6565 RepID=A0A8B8AUF3_CRAVI|nr:uncharacterized protein LOC111104931 [Crassostrea virginica]
MNMMDAVSVLVFMWIKNALVDGKCSNGENYTVTRCDGSYKKGRQIFVNFKQMIQPCDCTLQTSFSGELLVTATSDGYNDCWNKVTVSLGEKTTDWSCGSTYTTANTFNVVKNETVVYVKVTYYRDSAMDLPICLQIKKNGGLDGIVHVRCGHSTSSATATTATATTSATTATTTTATIATATTATTTTATATTSSATTSTATTSTATTSTLNFQTSVQTFSTYYSEKPSSEIMSSEHTYTVSITGMIITKNVHSSADYSMEDPNNVIYIIVGAVAGGVVGLVLVLLIVILIIINRGNEQNKAKETHGEADHTNGAFDENDGLPDNPLYHSNFAELVDEVGYSTIQNEQLGLPPTDETNKKKRGYDVPPNNKPIKDPETHSMPIYAVPNKSATKSPEDNPVQGMYAQVSKPRKVSTQVPVQSANQDGLIYLEVDNNAAIVNQNTPYTKNENKMELCTLKSNVIKY